jgi:hypothetical protein
MPIDRDFLHIHAKNPQVQQAARGARTGKGRKRIKSPQITQINTDFVHWFELIRVNLWLNFFKFGYFSDTYK